MRKGPPNPLARQPEPPIGSPLSPRTGTAGEQPKKQDWIWERDPLEPTEKEEWLASYSYVESRLDVAQ